MMSSSNSETKGGTLCLDLGGQVRFCLEGNIAESMNTNSDPGMPGLKPHISLCGPLGDVRHPSMPQSPRPYSRLAVTAVPTSQRVVLGPPRLLGEVRSSQQALDPRGWLQEGASQLWSLSPRALE